MKPKIRRIAVSTGGGDAPGLNAVIRAIVLAAEGRGWEVLGIRKGYLGLLDTSQVVELNRERVRGITHLGGTILGTTNRGNPFDWPERLATGEVRTADRSNEVVANFAQLGLDALIAIGGDGSMRIAHRLAALGLPLVGVPKTIDNDLEGTAATFGFDTAVTVATEAIDRLHSTAEAHERVFVVEVMGRYAGWIALFAGIAGGADAILIPEIPYSLAAVAEKIRDREAHGRRFSIVVVAEGAKPVGGAMTMLAPQRAGEEVRLGGVCEPIATALGQLTGKDIRTVTLGHLQRGGGPTAHDRLLALRFGAAAVRLVARHKFSVMVALDPPKIKAIALSAAIQRLKTVPLDGDAIATARDLGVCLGEASAT